MCESIEKQANLDSRGSTISAIVFWKICQYSVKYKDRINLNFICKNHDRLITRNKCELTFSFFDVTTENVRRVYRDYLQKDLFSCYLPKWDNRIFLTKDKHNNYVDYDY